MILITKCETSDFKVIRAAVTPGDAIDFCPPFHASSFSHALAISMQ